MDRFLTGLIIGLFTATILDFLLLPVMISSMNEKRCKDLNVMQFSRGKFMPKDSVVLTGGDLYYLINGTTKDK